MGQTAVVRLVETERTANQGYEAAGAYIVGLGRTADRDYEVVEAYIAGVVYTVDQAGGGIRMGQTVDQAAEVEKDAGPAGVRIR